MGRYYDIGFEPSLTPATERPYYSGAFPFPVSCPVSCPEYDPEPDEDEEEITD